VIEKVDGASPAANSGDRTAERYRQADLPKNGGNHVNGKWLAGTGPITDDRP